MVSILTAVGIARGVLIESSGNTSVGDRKGGGAREWIKNNLKLLSHLIVY